MSPLRKLRLHLGLTQKELGRILGLQQVTISHYEMGVRKPKNKTLLLLEKFCKTTKVKLPGKLKPI